MLLNRASKKRHLARPHTWHSISVIYVILCRDTGEYYVGQTSGTLNARWRFHNNAAKYGAKGPLNDAIRTHKNFRVFAIDSAPDGPELNARERMWIKALNPTLNRRQGPKKKFSTCHAEPTT